MKFDLATVSFILVSGLYCLGAVMLFLRRIAPLTATDLDDRLVDRYDAMRAWIYRFSPHFWAIVEEMYLAGLLCRDDKLDVYVGRFGKAFKAAFGLDLPQELKEEAETLAAGLSAKDRLERGIRDSLLSNSIPGIVDETQEGGRA